MKTYMKTFRGETVRNEWKMNNHDCPLAHIPFTKAAIEAGLPKVTEHTVKALTSICMGNHNLKQELIHKDNQSHGNVVSGVRNPASRIRYPVSSLTDLTDNLTVALLCLHYYSDINFILHQCLN